MRGIAILLAASSVWVLAGGSLPPAPRLRKPSVSPSGAIRALAVGGAVAALALGLTGTLVVSVALGTLAAAAPLAAESARHNRRQAAIADQWPDLLAALRSRLAGGESLQEAFEGAARRSGGFFEDAADRLSDHARTGAGFASAIEEVRAGMADPIADRVLATLTAATQSGGHRVSEIIGALSASVADELRLRKAHDAALTQQRLTAAVALVAPWGLLALTVASNPQAADVYRTASGSAVVLGGLVATSTGYLLARRAARLAKAPRVFQ